ncbi:protein of unknown function [Streptomyces murinus]
MESEERAPLASGEPSRANIRPHGN